MPEPGGHTSEQAFSSGEAGGTRLIEQETPASVRLIVVVPVYKEYANGNIFRLMESFTKQTAPLNTFELLLVVNNTPEAVAAQTPGYVENQQTIALGRYFEGKNTLPTGLTEYQAQVVTKAKSRGRESDGRTGLPIYFVDLSSQGLEKNIGRLRDIGVQEAMRRFAANGQAGEGIVAQLDADTVVEPQYVEKILQHFENPTTESLFVHLDYFTAEGPEELFRTSFHHQYGTIGYRSWMNLITGGEFEAGGPQAVAKVKALQKIGGIKHLEAGEDWLLADELRTKTKNVFAPEVRVYTSDRAREEGYDASERMGSLEMAETGKRYPDYIFQKQRPTVFFFIRELQTLVRNNPDALHSPNGEVQALFDQFGFPLHHDFLQEMVTDRTTQAGSAEWPLPLPLPLESAIRKHIPEYLESFDIPTKSASSNEYVNETIAFFESQFPPAETERLRKFVRQNLARAAVRLHRSRVVVTEAVERVFVEGYLTQEQLAKTLKEHDFYQQNPWMLELLNELPLEYRSVEDALTALTKRFPEWLAPLEKSRLRRSTALLHALIQYVWEAKNQPELCPHLTRLLDVVERSD